MKPADKPESDASPLPQSAPATENAEHGSVSSSRDSAPSISGGQATDLGEGVASIVVATIIDPPFELPPLPPQSLAYFPNLVAWPSGALPSPQSAAPSGVRVKQYTLALFSPKARAELFDGRPLAKIYSVPRRFDLSTLFVVSTAFAAMFALLGYLNFSSAAKLACCAFFSGIGIAQAVLYGSRAPRLSSVLAGGLMLSILPIMLYPPRNSIEWLCAGLGLGMLGLPSGYLAGTIVGGIFLIADYLRNWIARRANRKTATSSPDSSIFDEHLPTPISPAV